MAQQLPGKEQGIFRNIVKFYETKQYRKGIRAADTILKKFPDHGETLCMKGLIVSYLEKKEEAYELVRKGLKCNLRSHVCWHVFGMLYRQDRDYVEAVKCYRQALRIDPENLQILRDISLLQIHRRDFAGFAETRRRLLQTKPGNRLNWIGYAVSEHLCKEYEFAWTCLDNYDKTFKDEDMLAYDRSELCLYKAMIMEEGGKLEDTLEFLKQREKDIVDKLGLLEARGRICMFLGRYEEAESIFRKLLDKNPEHHTYVLAAMASQTKFHRFWPAMPKPSVVLPAGLVNVDKVDESEVPATISSFPPTVHPQGRPVAGWLPPQDGPQTSTRVAVGRRIHKKRADFCQPLVPLTDAEEEEVIKFFEELQAQYPRSDAVKRLVLHFITGERFKKRLDGYLRSRLRRGVPSLFRTMTPLYFQEGKSKLVEELLLQYFKHLQEEVSWFGPEVGETVPSSFTPEEEPPSSLLFTEMVLADHYDFLGNTDKALEFCNMAIEHTPTLVEIYATKAKIYRHAGNLQEAAKWSEEARSLDLSDRYLNTKCVTALLRLDDTQGGKEKALLFSREPDSVDAANLHDMQCMSYESKVGRSFTRQKNYGRALKMFGETFRHFTDIAEDQFDFHNYCLRKTTLKAYVNMLRMQEKLFSHAFYRRAAKDALKIYIELFDMKARGESVMNSTGVEGGEAEMSAADKKKLKHKMKREAAKTKEEKLDPKAAPAAGGKAKKVDEDPDGLKLLEKDPMEESNKLLRTLTQYCADDMATHVQTYEAMSRQGKLLQCLQALLKLWELVKHNNLHYKLVAPLAHFCFVADLEKADVPASVRQVVLSEAATLLGAPAPFADVGALRAAAKKVIDQVELRVKSNAELPVIEVMYSLQCLSHAGRDIKALVEKDWQPMGAFALKECTKMVAFLERTFGKESAACDKFKKRCLDIFPLMAL